MPHRRFQLIGHELGTEPVILIAWREPWGVYLSTRSFWAWDRMLRFRIGVGPQFGWGLIHLKAIKRDRCRKCQELIPGDQEGCNCNMRILRIDLSNA